MTIIQAAVLGITQGITELLPISSSAHLVLIPEIFGWELQETSFDIILHFGTLFALVLYFRKDLLKIIKNCSKEKYRKLIINLIITTIPAALIGFIFRDFIDEHFKSISVIVFMLISIGIIMTLLDRIPRCKNVRIAKLKAKDAFLIGLAQALALVRGTSRSGATIIGGALSGLVLKESARYAFLAAIPIILGVSTMQIAEFAVEGTGDIAISILSVGFFFSFISSFTTIRFLMSYIEKKGLFVFGVYRIIIGLILVFFVL